jgi:MerR family transcriptional regulator, heat shock protein HspR
MRQHHQAVYVISVAAELAGMHPQTLRIYERRGLVTPARTTGGNRRYSDADIARLRRIAELASTGMNLEGIRHVMSLEEEAVRLREEVVELRQRLMNVMNAMDSQSRGALVPLRQTVAIFGERPSIFRKNR